MSRSAPPTNTDVLIAAVAAGGTFDYLCFWGHRPAVAGVVDKACLSQWWPVRFEIDGIWYSSAEQYMMAEKARLFDDGAALRSILATDDPYRAKELARTVHGFDEQRWKLVRCDVVLAASLAKFSADPPLGNFLLGTAPAVLVEASPHDLVWGVGLRENDPRATDPFQWRGKNLLGFTLMEARRRLAD